LAKLLDAALKFAFTYWTAGASHWEQRSDDEIGALVAMFTA
jgi:hypothetical protein